MKKMRTTLTSGTLVAVLALSPGWGVIYAETQEPLVQTEVSVEQETPVEANAPTNLDASTVQEAETPSQPEVTQTEVTSNEGTNVETTSTEATNVEATSTDTSEGEGLQAGDFFYFVKVMIEKIQLALTFDKEEEAKLLAQFTEDRIQEAEGLLNEGKEDLAKETLQKAIEQQNQATELLPNANEEQVQTEETASEEQVQTEGTTSEEQVQTEGTTSEEQSQVEEGQGNEDEQKMDSPAPVIQQHLSQNIIALTAVMEKVKNPKVKAVMARNIEKAKAKYEQKLQKWQAKMMTKTPAAPTVETKVETTTAPTVETKVETTTAPTAETKVETTTAPTVETQGETTTAPTVETQGETTTAPTVETKVETTTAPTVETHGKQHKPKKENYGQMKKAEKSHGKEKH